MNEPRPFRRTRPEPVQDNATDRRSCLTCGVLIVLLVVLGTVGCGLVIQRSGIDDATAIRRFQALAGTTDVRIVIHSNTNPWLGNPNDVEYTLAIDGKTRSGHCADSKLSPIICRLYVHGEEN